MSSIYRAIALASWVLGVLSLIMAAVTKVMHLAMKVRVEPSTFLLLATALFLCTLATRSVERA